MGRERKGRSDDTWSLGRGIGETAIIFEVSVCCHYAVKRLA